MDNYTIEELRAFRDRKTLIPDEFQNDITNLQEAITHEQITNRMKQLTSIHARCSFLKQPEFMLSTINMLFNDIRSNYFNEEIIKRTERERARINYNNNKDKLKEKFNCECGGRYTRHHKARHIKSRKHQDYINA